MAYTITKTDGSTLLLLPDGSIDKTSTSLDLIGRNVNSYGESLNNNFIRLLENFADNTDNPPSNPLVGQLWYDNTTERLKVYSSTGFKSVSGAIISSAQPNTLVSGDLWWDSTKKQLRIYNQNTTMVIGPVFPDNIGENGWVLPSTTINDSQGIPRNVTLLKNYGSVVGLISNDRFLLTGTTALSYFNTTTTATVVSGLNISTELSGKYLNKHLSAFVILNAIGNIPGSGINPTNYLYYLSQNGTIASILSNMFPIYSNEATEESGIPLGSEARVICEYSGIPGLTQIRKFRVIDQSGTYIWNPVEIYSYNFADDGGGNPLTTSSNVISELQHN